MKNNYIPERGDIVWLNFDPQAGKEIKKRRPALILTPREYNRYKYAIVCPMTGNATKRPFKIDFINDAGIESAIIIEQIKSIDWRERQAEFKEKAPHDVVENAIDMIGMLLTQ